MGLLKEELWPGPVSGEGPTAGTQQGLNKCLLDLVFFAVCGAKAALWAVVALRGPCSIRSLRSLKMRQPWSVLVRVS